MIRFSYYFAKISELLRYKSVLRWFDCVLGWFRVVLKWFRGGLVCLGVVWGCFHGPGFVLLPMIP